jgi:hypothetical protein
MLAGSGPLGGQYFEHIFKREKSSLSAEPRVLVQDIKISIFWF